MARLVLCVLALLAIASPTALADPPGVATTVSGTLERTHVDSATGPRPVTFLSTVAGPQAVHFAAGEPIPPNGAEVDLHGRLAGDTLEATSATVTGPTIAVPDAGQQGTPLAVGVPQTVAIVVITFAGGTAPAYDAPYLHGVLVSNGNSVSNYFSEQSYGAVSFTGITSRYGDVYPVSIAADGSNCNSAWPTWGDEADAAVGISTIDQYDHVIYVFNSHGTCGWAGLGYLPGSQSFIDNSFILSVVAHELGHNLGVHHASSLRCVANGVGVAFSSTGSNCSSSEYGDPFDIMGSSATNQQDAFHKLQSGWLGSVNGPRVQTITTSGDYTLSPLEQPTGVALLLVPHVTGPVVGGASLGQDFALDLRQSYGSYFDAFAAGANATAGVQVRLVQTPGGYPMQTQLIDTTPLTATVNDAALLPGSTFTDSTDGISIQTLSVDPLGGATVRVTLGASAPDTTPPSAVSSLSASIATGPVVTLSFAAATDSGGVASYRVTRDGAQIASIIAPTTSFTDWAPGYGAHSYGVTAVDNASNVGPTATLGVTLAAPALPTPPAPAPTTTPAKPATPTPTPTITVRTRVVKLHGKTRRVIVSWSAVRGATSYTVLRNGHRLAVTRKPTLIDRSPPRGSLRYSVRSSG